MISEIQEALSKHNLDGWLFYDHHYRDPIAYRVLRLIQNNQPSRRWYYFIPTIGFPRKLVHRIEAQVIDQLPGEKDLYSSWREQQLNLRNMLMDSGRVAMQYSPNCAIPYVSNVDGGTLELVRSYGVEVVSSANLVQEFEARWSSEQLEMHLEAGRRVDKVRHEAFAFVAEKLGNSQSVTEYDVQTFIRNRFELAGLSTDHGPIVAVNQNASDPHYEPTAARNTEIQRNSLVLIDLWAKLKLENSVYYDVTWTGFCGHDVPSRIQNIFDIVRGARQAASDLVVSHFARRVALCGWEVDDAARRFIGRHELAEFFFHRTGHSIGTEVHGNGANMDNFESHDDRQIIADTCFSIEPGIYLPDFGIRSEVNVYVGRDKAWITGEEQKSLVRIVD